jgi:hypothetical protein
MCICVSSSVPRNVIIVASKLSVKHDVCAHFQSAEDAAAVLSSWNLIVDTLEYASREVTDWKVVFDARVVETRNAVDAVLDQVKKSH